MMVDYVRKMTVKKSCMYGKYGSFVHLLFLLIHMDNLLIFVISHAHPAGHLIIIMVVSRMTLSVPLICGYGSGSAGRSWNCRAVRSLGTGSSHLSLG